jgi:hypothetical protein
LRPRKDDAARAWLTAGFRGYDRTFDLQTEGRACSLVIVSHALECKAIPSFAKPVADHTIIWSLQDRSAPRIQGIQTASAGQRIHGRVLDVDHDSVICPLDSKRVRRGGQPRDQDNHDAFDNEVLQSTVHDCSAPHRRIVQGFDALFYVGCGGPSIILVG